MNIAETAGWGKYYLKKHALVGLLVALAAGSFCLGLLTHLSRVEKVQKTESQATAQIKVDSPSMPEAEDSSNDTTKPSSAFEQSRKTKKAPHRQPTVSNTTMPAPTEHNGEVVAAKSGHTYYFQSCGTVKRIKEENKIYFKTRAEAERAGYTPAKNCKGM